MVLFCLRYSRVLAPLNDVKLVTNQNDLHTSSGLAVGGSEGVGGAVHVAVGGAGVKVTVGVHVGGSVGRTKAATVASAGIAVGRNVIGVTVGAFAHADIKPAAIIMPINICRGRLLNVDPIMR